MSDFGNNPFDAELAGPSGSIPDVPLPINPNSEEDTTPKKLAEAINDLRETIEQIVNNPGDDNRAELSSLSEAIKEVAERTIGSPDHETRIVPGGFEFNHAEDFGEEELAAQQQESFIGKIGATPTKDGSNYRWSYTWTEQAKTSTGHAGWATKSGGRSGTAGGSDAAYNTMEDMNGATGTFGNGATSANLSTAEYLFTVEPAPPNLLVRMWPVVFVVGSTESTEYWFSYANGVDGSCI